MPQSDYIPVSVIVITRNEERRIARCLRALEGFAEVIVVDSGSDDRTCEIARAHGAVVIGFKWNGHYPKKRQWCLDHLELQHAWVFFVDADEVVSAELREEIRQLDFQAAGYFVRGRYVYDGRTLRFGLTNNKLALIDRRKMMFPEVDDLDLPGMGEIEGHYQPVRKAGHETAPLRQLLNPLLHFAYEEPGAWLARHKNYAAWERGMNKRQAWPPETASGRHILKAVFRRLPMRPLAAFIHSYVLKGGFLDGLAGWHFARSRYVYYRMISASSTDRA